MHCKSFLFSATVLAFSMALGPAGAEAKGPKHPSPCAIEPLDILLTNDDGYDSVGIRAMKAALEDAGHHVVVVAPATNSSGSSAMVTLAAVAVNNPEPNTYSVAGSPATTVLLGITAIFGSDFPDLVVSGINDGANLGPAAVISGTVGAAVTAITQFASGVPAIAVSTDKIEGTQSDVGSAANVAHFAEVAAFTARLIDHLLEQSCRQKKPILPPRTGLNVNYPPLPADEAKGPVVAVQGRTPFFLIGYAEVVSGLFVPQFSLVDEPDPTRNADTRLFEEGFVTIVPIDGDYTSPSHVQRQLGSLLHGLTVDPEAKPVHPHVR